MTEQERSGLPEDSYSDLPEFEPEREDIEIEGDMGGGHRSLEEAEVNSANVPDLQFALKRLFPMFPYAIINRVAQSAMVARIHPDTYVNRIVLTVDDVLDAWDYKKDGIPSVQLVIELVSCAFSIGLDGKGREDVVVVAGAAESAKELEKLSKEFNLGR